jgi:hypothetical protein
MVMVVTPFLPILLLSMIDDVPYDATLVASSSAPSCAAQVHDGAWELIFGLDVACDHTVILFELARVVVPMDW